MIFYLCLCTVMSWHGHTDSE